MDRVSGTRTSSAKGTQGKPKARGKKTVKGKSAELEALGLFLLALGFMLLGLLFPILPTGEFGAVLREVLVAPVGLGAYLYPWPFLILGGFFLLGRAPKDWPRWLAGYAVTGLGVWVFVALLWPALTAEWGMVLHGTVGSLGVLAVLMALIVVTLGLDIFLGLPPSALLITGVRGGTLGVQQALQGGLRVRRDVKAKAAFAADVALLRKRVRRLEYDMSLLDELYPGSAEVNKWRELARTAHDNLKWADAAILQDTERDADAWEKAVGSFTKTRAAELAVQLTQEGLPSFDLRQEDLTETLAEPQNDWTLDGVRKLLGLELTALGERYSRALRGRDLSHASLQAADPALLAQAQEQHTERLRLFGELDTAQRALEDDAALLTPWDAFMARVAALRQDYPKDVALRSFESELQACLKRGRASLAELHAQAEALDALEASIGLITADSEPVALKVMIHEEIPDVSELDRLEDEAPFDVSEDVLDTSQAPTDDFEDLEDDVREPIPEVGGFPITLPPLELLESPLEAEEDPAARNREVRTRITKIDETLSNFRLQGRVLTSVRGPTVTRFEVEPAPGEKISRFSGLSDDLALAMAVGSVRIEAPIPGKSVIGLEVPNAHRDLIKFREAAEAPSFRRSKARLPLILGKSIDGEMLIGDLARMPHLLIAGSTGSGKSVAVNTLVGSLLYKFLPTDLRFLMIDPKMVELTPFDGIPHLLRPVVTNPNDASGVLLGLVAHMERRYKMMSKIGAKNLDQYNQKARTLDLPELPFIIIIIDELADLMITSPKEVESAIMRLAQMARATGMHLVLATQRPSVDILTSLIKVNVPARVAFAVSSGHDSRTILDTMGAERLTGMGDMLYYQPGLPKPVRLQGPFISEEEIFTLANFLRRQYFDDEFVEAYGSDFDPPPMDESSASGMIDWDDDKLREAAELVVNLGEASVSRLQRRLSVGHARAGKLMDSLEALGVVGPHIGSKPREVLVESHELPDIFGK